VQKLVKVVAKLSCYIQYFKREPLSCSFKSLTDLGIASIKERSDIYNKNCEGIYNYGKECEAKRFKIKLKMLAAKNEHNNFDFTSFLMMAYYRPHLFTA